MDNLNKLLLILAGIGVPDAIYHAFDEITNFSSPLSNVCNINNVFSCASVFRSGYTTFLGVSLWVYGVVWFPFILLLGYWFIRKQGGVNVFAMLPVLMVGNVFTVYLWYLEFTKIHAFCLVCISMYCLNYLMTAVCVAMALRQE